MMSLTKLNELKDAYRRTTDHRKIRFADDYIKSLEERNQTLETQNRYLKAALTSVEVAVDRGREFLKEITK